MSSGCCCFEQERLAGCLTPRLLATVGCCGCAAVVVHRPSACPGDSLCKASVAVRGVCFCPPVINMSARSSHPQIVSHVEAWDVTPGQALLLLLKPSERAAWRQRQSAQQQR